MLCHDEFTQLQAARKVPLKFQIISAFSSFKSLKQRIQYKEQRFCIYNKNYYISTTTLIAQHGNIDVP